MRPDQPVHDRSAAAAHEAVRRVPGGAIEGPLCVDTAADGEREKQRIPAGYLAEPHTVVASDLRCNHLVRVRHAIERRLDVDGADDVGTGPAQVQLSLKWR